MVDPNLPPPSDAPSDPGPRGGARRLVLALGALVVVVVAVVVVLAVREGSRARPSFPSLADTPDPTLHGTVAYLDNASCVRIVAAAGSPSKQVWCLPPLDPADAEANGKPIGPQLAWRDGGRLEITMFRMGKDPKAMAFTAGWQRVVDVRTGAVTETPAAQVPSTPAATGRATVSPDGRVVSFTSDSSTGRATVTLTDAKGAVRTLLDVHGPGKYTYGIGSAFWSPDFRWVAVDDGRILVITVDDPAVTRVLVEPGDAGFGPNEPASPSRATTCSRRRAELAPRPPRGEGHETAAAGSRAGAAACPAARSAHTLSAATTTSRPRKVTHATASWSGPWYVLTVAQSPADQRLHATTTAAPAVYQAGRVSRPCTAASTTTPSHSATNALSNAKSTEVESARKRATARVPASLAPVSMTDKNASGTAPNARNTATTDPAVEKVRASTGEPSSSPRTCATTARNSGVASSVTTTPAWIAPRWAPAHESHAAPGCPMSGGCG